MVKHEAYVVTVGGKEPDDKARRDDVIYSFKRALERKDMFYRGGFENIRIFDVSRGQCTEVDLSKTDHGNGKVFIALVLIIPTILIMINYGLFFAILFAAIVIGLVWLVSK